MKGLLLFGSFGAGEVIVIALIVLLLFGGKKIPELMKGIGKGVKSFKDGVKGSDFSLKFTTPGALQKSSEPLFLPVASAVQVSK